MRKILSRLIVIAVVIGVSLFILQKAGEFGETLLALSAANLWMLIPAIILTVAYIAIHSRVLHASLLLTGTKIPYRHAVQLWLGSHFVNAMVPSGFFSGMTYLLLKGKKWQPQKISLVIGVVVSIFAAYIAILSLFFGGAFLHILNPDQSVAVKIAAQTLALVVGLLVVASLVMVEHFSALLSFVQKAHRFIRKLSSRKTRGLDIENPFEQVNSILTSLHKRWVDLLEPIGDALLTHAIGLGILLSAFWSLGYPVPPSTLLTGYVVGVLLSIVSITPDGLGFVEVAVPLVFVSFGVPIPIATAATLIWRVCTFWAVLGFGGVAFRSLEKDRHRLGAQVGA